MRIIKRYRNRRLYDTEQSKTLTQTDLAELIRKGVEIKIVESSTGEDITVAVLGRVLTAQAPQWGSESESRDLLSKIISVGGEKSMSLLKNTVLASIGVFQVSKAKAEEVIDELIKRGELDQSDRKKAVLELLDKAEASTSKFTDKVTKEAGKVQKEVAAAIKKVNVAKKDDLKKLEGKVDKLAKSLKKIEKMLDEKE